MIIFCNICKENKFYAFRKIRKNFSLLRTCNVKNYFFLNPKHFSNYCSVALKKMISENLHRFQQYLLV